jgi:membrane-associated phospholipid phosphatase
LGLFFNPDYMVQIHRSFLSFWRESFFNRIFIFFVALGWLPFLFFDKGQEILFINRYATPWLDFLMMNLTHLGKGYMWVFIIVMFLFIRFSQAITAVLVLMCNGVLIVIFKQLLFKGMARPIAYLPKESFYHLIDGFTYFTTNTFPSGHTMSAFTIAFFLGYYIRDMRVSAILMFYALLIGFSRMYLLLHFYADVYMGALAALMSFMLARFLAERVLLLPNRKSLSNALQIVIKPTILTTKVDA